MSVKFLTIEQTFVWTFQDGETRAWSIVRAKKFLAGRLPALSISLEQLREAIRLNQERDAIDDRYALTTDTNQPIIAVFNPQNRVGEEMQCLIIDGWHRMRKADLQNIPELDVHVLMPDEAKLCEVQI